MIKFNIQTSFQSQYLIFTNIRSIFNTFFRTKILKKRRKKEQNKKDNPKEIFYEFLKLFRKQKEMKNKSFPSPTFLKNRRIYFSKIGFY